MRKCPVYPTMTYHKSKVLLKNENFYVGSRTRGCTFRFGVENNYMYGFVLFDIVSDGLVLKDKVGGSGKFKYIKLDLIPKINKLKITGVDDI